MLTTARSHPAEHAHVWHFVHVYPFFLGVREDSQALHTRFSHLTPFVLRLTITHVLTSCVGVRLGSGSSGESTVVKGPSPGTRMSGQGRSASVSLGARGCNQATGQMAMMQNFKNLPRLGLAHMLVAKACPDPCP